MTRNFESGAVSRRRTDEADNQAKGAADSANVGRLAKSKPLVRMRTSSTVGDADTDDEPMRVCELESRQSRNTRGRDSKNCSKRAGKNHREYRVAANLQNNSTATTK